MRQCIRKFLFRAENYACLGMFRYKKYLKAAEKEQVLGIIFELLNLTFNNASRRHNIIKHIG